MKYNIEHIAAVIKGSIIMQHDNAGIEHLLLDSRKLIFPSSSLFFAVQSARRNGHDFLTDLHKKGVRNFIVHEEVNVTDLPGSNIIRVANTLSALQSLTKYHRLRFSIPVIGITGSNGKTIVKEWLNQMLQEKYHIVRSPKSFNSQIGVPLSVWQMNETHTLGIFEAGISMPGEMSKLQKIIQPTIGIFTNIGSAHSEGFVNNSSKVKEKLHLFVHVDTLIYCRDYPDINEEVGLLLQQLRRSNEKPFSIFSWSAVSPADLKIISIVSENTHTHITALHDAQSIEVIIPFIDKASVENAIHCLCVLLLFQVPLVNIREKMAGLTPVAMRLELKEGINNCSIINDSYSADLSSLDIALDFLAQQQQHSKRTVILTDIFESGKNPLALYNQVSQSLQQRSVNRLIGIGENISMHSAAFKNIPGLDAHFYLSLEAFRNAFPLVHFSNETILIKGARVFELEEVSRLLEKKIHQTLLEIDLNAIVHNLQQYQQILRPDTKIMAMVKAFSYGSGSYEIANVLQFHGVGYLAVAYADEGVELRKAGIQLPVMVMNTDESAFDILVQYNLEPEIYSYSLLHSLEKFLKDEGINSFPIHIEIETGMNRLGFSADQLNELIKGLQSPVFIVKSIFTHLVASEDPLHDEFTKSQASTFRKIYDQVSESIPYKILAHISNSSGISRHPELEMDMVRLGIGLYGIDSGNSKRISLKEVSTLRSTIAQIKTITKNETVGYGRSGVVLNDSRIATVRIGYADGYPRSLGNGLGKMSINGHLAPVIGNVCMDMTMIDITAMPDIKEGDEVIVFGKELPVFQLAQWGQTIAYEILTGISQRVKRVYFQE